jgi:uncharacterized protein
MKQRISPLALLMLLSALPGGAGGGCREAKPVAASGDTVPMKIGNETFNLEVADSPDEMEYGLMARESMPADHGMIFVFPKAKQQAFWMKNTFIPLDIIYVDEFGRVVSVKPMQPRDETPVRSDGPAMYAIELNQGAAARAGVRAGDVLSIPPTILTQKGRK